MQRQRNPSARLHQHLGALEHATSIPAAGALPKQGRPHTALISISILRLQPSWTRGSSSETGRTHSRQLSSRAMGRDFGQTSTGTARGSASRAVPRSALLQMAPAKVLNTNTSAQDTKHLCQGSAPTRMELRRPAWSRAQHHAHLERPVERPPCSHAAILGIKTAPGAHMAPPDTPLTSHQPLSTTQGKKKVASYPSWPFPSPLQSSESFHSFPERLGEEGEESGQRDGLSEPTPSPWAPHPKPTPWTPRSKPNHTDTPN